MKLRCEADIVPFPYRHCIFPFFRKIIAIICHFYSLLFLFSENAYFSSTLEIVKIKRGCTLISNVFIKSLITSLHLSTSSSMHGKNREFMCLNMKKILLKSRLAVSVAWSDVV